MSLLFKSTRTSQPQDRAEPNNSYPRPRSVFAPSGINALDVLAGAPITPSISIGVAGATSGFGKSWKFTNTDTTCLRLDSSVRTQVTTRLHLVQFGALGTINRPLSNSQRSVGSGTGGLMLRVESTGAISWLRSYTANMCTSGAASLVAGKVHCIVATNSGSAATFWVDGRQLTSGAYTAASPTFDGLYLGCESSSGGGAGSFDGNFGLYADWDSVLTPLQCKQLSENPWQLFAPQSRSLWIPGTVSAGGAATVIPVGVQSTGSVGTPTGAGAANALPTGVSATASVGTPVATGGTSIPATVLPAGVQAVGSVGALIATGAAWTVPAGVGAVGSVGTPIASGAAIAQCVGVSATAYVGTPTASAGLSGAAIAYPAGVQAIGSVGTLIATGASWAIPLGVPAVGSVGTPVAHDGSVIVFDPSIYVATSPAMSYSASVSAQAYGVTSPAQSYTVIVPEQNYSA